MGSPYEIMVDRREGTIEVRMSGSWTLEDLSHYALSIRPILTGWAVTQGSKPNLLIDAMETVVQSPEVTSAMRTLSEELAPQLRRTAMLTNAQLLRLQAKRVVTDLTTSETFACFSDRDAALAWLRSGG